jgi:hypothetical protein
MVDRLILLLRFAAATSNATVTRRRPLGGGSGATTGVVENTGAPSSHASSVDSPASSTGPPSSQASKLPGQAIAGPVLTVSFPPGSVPPATVWRRRPTKRTVLEGLPPVGPSPSQDRSGGSWPDERRFKSAARTA